MTLEITHKVSNGSQALVASMGEKIVGYLIFKMPKDGYAQVINLTVHKDYRKQGIATALCEQFLSIATVVAWADWTDSGRQFWSEFTKKHPEASTNQMNTQKLLTSLKNGRDTQ